MKYFLLRFALALSFLFAPIHFVFSQGAYPSMGDNGGVDPIFVGSPIPDASFGSTRAGRLGIGLSNQLKNHLPAP